MSKSPETFVTLQRYTNDLSRQVHRDKLLIEKIEKEIRLTEIDFSEGTKYSKDKLVVLREVIEWLKLPLDFWFTQSEFHDPLKASSDKFSSVSDGVPLHFEFEGER